MPEENPKTSTKRVRDGRTGGNAALGRWPVMVTLATYRRLKALATKRGVTVFALAEEIVSAALDRKQKDAGRKRSGKPSAKANGAEADDAQA